MVPQINGARCPISLGALRAEVGRPSSGCRASPVLDQGCGIGTCGSTCGAVSAAAMHAQSFAASEFAQAWSTRCAVPLRRSGADARKSPHPRPGCPFCRPRRAGAGERGWSRSASCTSREPQHRQVPARQHSLCLGGAAEASAPGCAGPGLCTGWARLRPPALMRRHDQLMASCFLLPQLGEKG